MMKFVAAAVLASLLTLGMPVPAQADTPRCASKKEYYRISNGTSMARVHRIFDIRGHIYQGMDSSWYQERKYRNCTGRDNPMVIQYQKKHGVWRVVGRFAIWGWS